MKTLIFGGTVVNEGVARKASVIVDNDVITEIVEGTDSPRGNYDSVVDATGCFVLPGVIADHVHFRDPGLTQKADMESESRAAAYGVVPTNVHIPLSETPSAAHDALDGKSAGCSRKANVTYS